MLVLRAPLVALLAGLVMTPTGRAGNGAGDPAGTHARAALAGGTVTLVAEGDGARIVGQGALVGPDRIVTSYHVIAHASTVQITLPNGSTTTTRQAWALDPARDVAVLSVPATATGSAGALALAPSFQGATRVLAASDPALAAVRVTIATGNGRTHLVGAVSTQPGDSGGPVLDAEGRLVGIVALGRAARPGDSFAEGVSLVTDPRAALRRAAHRPHPLTIAAMVREAERVSPQAAVYGALSRGAPSDRLSAAAAVADDPLLDYLVGEALLARGEAARARSHYERALAGAPSLFPAAYALGHVLYLAGDYRRAGQAFVRSRVGYPALGGVGYAESLMAQARYGAAVAVLRDLLAEHPGTDALRFLLVLCDLAQGETEAAERGARHLERVAPDWADRLWPHLQRASPTARPEVAARER